jgi:biopolymer transport protein ExbD/biopolymer transport protein TolR
MSLGGGGGRKHDVKPSMNVTPLVDIVLVLLIIFMVVTPLLSKQFWLNLPKKDENAEQQPPPPDDLEKPLVLTVEKTGAIKVNSNEIAKDELKVRLERMLAARTDKVVYFNAEDDAPYAIAVETMDLARMGGAKTIAIMTEKYNP